MHKKDNFQSRKNNFMNDDSMKNDYNYKNKNGKE